VVESAGIKLLVNSEDVDVATRSLDEPIPEEIDFEGAADYQQPRCPRCQSLDINFEELYKPIAYGSLFVSFPLPMQRNGWICQTCHHTWEDAAPEPEQEITPATS
jgi:rubredoxin